MTVVIKAKSNDSMISQVAEIRKAIKCGLQDKALTMMKENKHYLSKRDMLKLWIDPVIDVPIKEWLYTNCLGGQLVDMTIKKQKLSGEYAWPRSSAVILIRHKLSAVHLNRQLRDASLRGYLEVVKLLLECGNERIDPSADNNFAIQHASRQGHLEVVKLLLGCGDERIDPSANNNYAIRYASFRGHTEVVKLLLECGDERIDPSACDNFAIREASFYGHLEVVKLLEEKIVGKINEDDKNIAGSLRHKSAIHSSSRHAIDL